MTVEPVPLFPRRRLVGAVFGGFTSVRRGEGSDIASSRPYQPGDHVRTIDWKSSARLATARGNDEFIVRERHAEEMPRVVVVCDRRPQMALFPPELPWLHKPTALRHVGELVAVSALNQHGLVGHLEWAPGEDGSDPGPRWHPPRPQSSVWGGDLIETVGGYLAADSFAAPEDNLTHALGFLTLVGGAVPQGSFVFVLSDFLVSPPAEVWSAAAEQGWDVVPVIVQDPIWEQSFPPLGGVPVPLVDAGGGGVRTIRLNAREAEERRRANEARLDELHDEFLRLGLDPLLVGDGGRDAIRRAFLDWSDRRLELRGRAW